MRTTWRFARQFTFLGASMVATLKMAQRLPRTLPRLVKPKFLFRSSEANHG